MQKLKDPRSFDQGKVKEYHDKLRMPQFNLTDEERNAITTFVLSLTEEQVPLEMQKRLTTEEQKVEKGRTLVKKLNCSGCHTLDGHEGGIRKAMQDDLGAAPPIIEGEGAKVKEEWLHAFLHHPTVIRPWLTYRMPTFNFSDEELKTLVEYFAYQAHQEVSYKGYEAPPTSAEKVQAGKELFEKFQCAKCHQVNTESAAMGSSFLAPDLTLAKHRLKPEWIKNWVKDPQAIQEGTMMPGFFPEGQSPVEDILGGDAQKQIEAIRDYLYQYEPNGSNDNSKKNK
jgi:mono/diheme cytochrome c family protein